MVTPIGRQRISRRHVLGAGFGLIAFGCFSSAPAADPSIPAIGTIPGPGATVSPADATIDAGAVDFQEGRDRILAFRSRPKGAGPFPGILVLHDNRGLSDHIRDVTRRLAKVGYVGLALDFLSRTGGTENNGDSSSISSAIGRITPERANGDVQAALRYLQGLNFVKTDSLGVVGFDFGGTYAYLTADSRNIRAVVPFYGASPPLDRVSRFQAAIFAIYAESDSRLTPTIGPLDEAMKKAGRSFEYKIYPGTSRGFHNEALQAYQIDAAQDAWVRTVGFFNRHLKK